MTQTVFNVTEFTKSMLYNCIKVVRFKPDQPNQWLYTGLQVYTHMEIFGCNNLV